MKIARVTSLVLGGALMLAAVGGVQRPLVGYVVKKAIDNSNEKKAKEGKAQMDGATQATVAGAAGAAAGGAAKAAATAAFTAIYTGSAIAEGAEVGAEVGAVGGPLGIIVGGAVGAL